MQDCSSPLYLCAAWTLCSNRCSTVLMTAEVLLNVCLREFCSWKLVGLANALHQKDPVSSQLCTPTERCAFQLVEYFLWGLLWSNGVFVGGNKNKHFPFQKKRKPFAYESHLFILLSLKKLINSFNFFQIKILDLRCNSGPCIWHSPAKEKRLPRIQLPANLNFYTKPKTKLVVLMAVNQHWHVCGHHLL